MKYFLLILLISAMIIGNVIGETREAAMARMIRNAGNNTANTFKRDIYRCVYRPPPQRPHPSVWA